jgi:hypothetical protein
MTTTERELIMRAQRHGWTVALVTADCVLMVQYWIRHGIRHQIFIFPDGQITARTEKA